MAQKDLTERATCDVGVERHTIGVLSSDSNWYLQDLRRAANSRSIEIRQLSFGEMSLDLQQPPSPQMNAVLVRSMPQGSLEQIIFRMDALRFWENSGVRVLNSPVGLEIAIDKALTLIRMQQAKIAFPRTCVVQTADQAMDLFEAWSVPLVVKPIFGGEGRGILRVDSLEMAHRVFKTLEQIRAVIYCQEFLPDVERDIRILLVGKKWFAGIRKNADSWITNASNGGSMHAYQPTELELEMARRAAAATQTELAGVDLLVGHNGICQVIEVNAVPGWKSLARAVQADIADEVLSFLLR